MPAAHKPQGSQGLLHGVWTGTRMLERPRGAWGEISWAPGMFTPPHHITWTAPAGTQPKRSSSTCLERSPSPELKARGLSPKKNLPQRCWALPPWSRVRRRIPPAGA